MAIFYRQYRKQTVLGGKGLHDEYVLWGYTKYVGGLHRLLMFIYFKGLPPKLSVF